MDIKISSNAKDIAKRVGKKGKELSDSVKRALSRTAQAGVNIIEDRTAEGKGIDGAFRKYSPSYQKAKSSGWPKTDKRRGFGGDSTGIVNLSVHGTMLGSMTTRANSRQAEIFFSRATESKKAAMNNKTRPFFGFNRKEEKRLGQVFFRNLK